MYLIFSEFYVNQCPRIVSTPLLRFTIISPWNCKWLRTQVKTLIVNEHHTLFANRTSVLWCSLERLRMKSNNPSDEHAETSVRMIVIPKPKQFFDAIIVIWKCNKNTSILCVYSRIFGNTAILYVPKCFFIHCYACTFAMVLRCLLNQQTAHVMTRLAIVSIVWDYQTMRDQECSLKLMLKTNLSSNIKTHYFLTLHSDETFTCHQTIGYRKN